MALLFFFSLQVICTTVIAICSKRLVDGQFFFQQKLATHSISLKYMRHLLKDNRNNPYSPTLSHKQNVLHKIDNDKKMKLFMSIFYFPQYFTIFFL